MLVKTREETIILVVDASLLLYRLFVQEISFKRDNPICIEKDCVSIPSLSKGFVLFVQSRVVTIEQQELLARSLVIQIRIELEMRTKVCWQGITRCNIEEALTAMH